MITKGLLATVVLLTIVTTINLALWFYVSMGFYLTIVQGG